MYPITQSMRLSRFLKTWYILDLFLSRLSAKHISISHSVAEPFVSSNQEGENISLGSSALLEASSAKACVPSHEISESEIVEAEVLVAARAKVVALPPSAGVIRLGYVSFSMLWPILVGKGTDNERRTAPFRKCSQSQVCCSMCSSRSRGGGALQMMMDDRTIRQNEIHLA